ncbi:MAG: homoserine O-succinyltransferase [Bacteroidaceae bacterium]|nr:homoserine O-succinyltransferase [Bacteroidaceae bacterium]
MLLELPKRPLPTKPLRIAILNLMPKKIEAEADYARLLSASPLPLEVHLMKVRSHICKNTPLEHMNAHYRFFDEMQGEHFDGFIMTGAPVEKIDFEQVDYWPELCSIFTWARSNANASLFICWAAQAALYFHYGIPKYPLHEKMFGIFPQVPLHPELPIFAGFDDIFNMPHSRHTEIRKEDILKANEELKMKNEKLKIEDGGEALTIIAEGPQSGVSMVMAREGRELFITGHAEYAPMRLDTEYRRDLGKGLPIRKPYNYYREDDPELGPLVTWSSHANLLFQNWINHYVCP